MTKPNQKARQVIDRIKYITIATVDQNGQPWNTPVASFRFDNDYIFYWASWTDNQHSKNIRSNGRAFIAIYDSTPVDDKPSDGVYIQAEAFELSDKQEVMRTALIFKGDPYNPSDGKQYLGEYPRRIYKAVPQKIWMNHMIATPNGYIARNNDKSVSSQLDWKLFTDATKQYNNFVVGRKTMERNCSLPPCIC
jgi:hypothetical protein